MANNFINKVKIGSDYYSIAIPYGTCSVAAGTAAKTVSCSNFALAEGVQIKVKFTYANTADNPTLNVNSTGAKAIKVYGTTAATTAWKAGSVVDFTYDGTNWIITGFGALQEGTCTVSGGSLSKGDPSGGGLSGGGLTAGAGQVSITQNPEITPSIGRSYTVSGATDSTYGVTTTQPSSGDYATFDPGATVNKEAKAKGRGTVSRAAVTRAAFSQTVTRADIKDTRTEGWIAGRSATTVISSDYTTVSLAADSTTIGVDSATSNYSSESSSSTTVNAGTNYYIPIANASATAGTASASASIAKQPSASATAGTASASASQTGMTAGVSSTATSYYFTSSASATGGSASAASGYSTASASATGGSASVSKGITAGASASGSSSGNKSATSTEVTDSATGANASDSSTIYLKEAAIGSEADISGSGQTTLGYGKQRTIAAGYTPGFKIKNSVGAVSGSIGLSNNTAGSATAAISNTDSMAEIASTSGKTAGTDYFRVKASATGTNGSVTPKYTVSTAGYIASSVTGSATSVTVSSDTTGQTINIIKAAITNNTTLPSGSSSSGTINAGSYIKIEPGYNKNTLYYQAASNPTLSGDATEANVLYGKTFYSNSYIKKTGSMTNNGAVSQTLNTSTTSYTVPAGYHNGSGTVSITLETKSASAAGDITPTSGKVLSKVTVGSGSATPGATVSGSSSALTSPTAMNNQYFTVTPTASVGTAGWIASISNGTQLKYKVKDGSVTRGTTTTASGFNADKYIISEGWVGSSSVKCTITEVSNATTLDGLVTASGNAGIAYKYTGDTTTVNGNTYIKNNIYIYE